MYVCVYVRRWSGGDEGDGDGTQSVLGKGRGGGWVVEYGGRGRVGGLGEGV